MVLAGRWEGLGERLRMALDGQNQDLRAPYQVRGDPVSGTGQAVISGLAGYGVRVIWIGAIGWFELNGTDGW